MQIDGHSLSLEKAIRVVREKIPVTLSEQARRHIQQSRRIVVQCLADGKARYGINTGFGKLAEVKISAEHLDQLQENLVLSHACGVGKPLSAEAVRAILLLKANTLAKGFSGVREEVVDLLLDLLNKNVLPVIPQQGSVGASGDLAPLAHMALVLIGRGEAATAKGIVAGEIALADAGLQPLRLQAKEGLALLNGTHFMTGLGLITWDLANRAAKTADIIGGMSAEALLCTPTAFDARIHQARGYPGQKESARRLRLMMTDSPIRDSHLSCNRVQDPYSVRCMPQVHGAILDNLQHVGSILAIELNAATDNPLIFSDDQEILSGGNFHGHPIATVMDLLGILMSQLANISERRVEFMMDPNMSALPPFLTQASGINSGFMIAQVTAASLVSENKVLSHPASVDSIPTSANKEDYVTMGAFAAVKARQIVDNCIRVLGIELLCASQSLELRAPLQPGPASKAVLEVVRREIPMLGDDRILAPDISKAADLIAAGQILAAVERFFE